MAAACRRMARQSFIDRQLQEFPRQSVTFATAIGCVGAQAKEQADRLAGKTTVEVGQAMDLADLLNALGEVVSGTQRLSNCPGGLLTHTIMSHWLHCNGCYCQPDSVELRFYITNCSHIYCEKCVTPCTKERCKVCRSQCTTLMLGGKIPKEVESLFCDPVDLHQKMTKQFYQTLEFQKSHQRRLLRRFKEKLKTFELQINEVRDVIMQAKAMEREFIKLKAENDYMKLLLSKKDGHPRSTSRAGVSPNSFSCAPGQTLQFARSQNTGSAQQRNMRGLSSILTQPGRLLMRTPPSDGHLGRVSGGLNYTPSSVESKTPISVPRPIHLHKSE